MIDYSILWIFLIFFLGIVNKINFKHLIFKLIIHVLIQIHMLLLLRVNVELEVFSLSSSCSCAVECVMMQGFVSRGLKGSLLSGPRGTQAHEDPLERQVWAEVVLLDLRDRRDLPDHPDDTLPVRKTLKHNHDI